MTAKTISKNVLRYVSVLVLFLMLQTISTVVAQEKPIPNTAVLREPKTDTRQILIPNPYGCVATIDLPHYSSHVSNTINVVAKTKCPRDIILPIVHVDVVIQIELCTLLYCYWQDWGAKGSKTKLSDNNSKANSSTPCSSASNLKYRGVSYHYIVDATGTLYETTQISQSVVLPCPRP